MLSGPIKRARVVCLFALTAGLTAIPSQAAPECELFLVSGPGVAYSDDPAFLGCASNYQGVPDDTLVPGGPYDTSILMPGALGAYGFIRGDATARTPTHGRITVREMSGAVSSTPVTFRWRPGGSSWPFIGGNWVTKEWVPFPATAVFVMIEARFEGRRHRHAYGRVAPPGPGNGAVRSGTILVPDRPTNGGPAPGCRNTPDCLAWRATCRLPVSQDGVMSSIVDVESLAGRPNDRTFVIVDQTFGTEGLGYDGLTIELWDRHCSPIRVPSGLENTKEVTFKIPARAKWMTVVPGCYWICMSVGGAAMRWELR